MWSSNSWHDNLSTHHSELSDLFLTFWRYLVSIFAWWCHLLERRHIFPCQFAVSLNAFFGMTFHIIAPDEDLFQGIFSFIWFFSSASLVVIYFLNNSVVEWTTCGSTFASLSAQPEYTWSGNRVGSSRLVSFCRILHIESMLCFFPINFYLIHMNR